MTDSEQRWVMVMVVAWIITLVIAYESGLNERDLRIVGVLEAIQGKFR